MLRALTDLPLWLKPNAGIPKRVQGRITYEVSSARFAAGILELVDAGANGVGGCCGRSPTYVRAVARALSLRHY